MNLTFSGFHSLALPPLLLYHWDDCQHPELAPSSASFHTFQYSLPLYSSAFLHLPTSVGTGGNFLNELIPVEVLMKMPGNLSFLIIVGIWVGSSSPKVQGKK